MPKQKKGNATQPPPTKQRSTHISAANSHLHHNTSHSNYNTVATSQPTRGIAATPKPQSLPTAQTITTTINMSEKPDNTSMGAMQQQSPQTQQLISQLSNVIQLLTTSLSGNALTNNPTLTITSMFVSSTFLV